MWSVQAGALSVCSRVERGRRGAAAEGDGSMAPTGRPSQRRLPLVSRPARLPLHRTSSYASHLSVCNTQHFAAARERSTVMCVSVSVCLISQQRRISSTFCGSVLLWRRCDALRTSVFLSITSRLHSKTGLLPKVKHFDKMGGTLSCFADAEN